MSATFTTTTTTMRPTMFVPSDTVKWNDKITAPIIIPIVAIVVVLTFFICSLIKCLKVTWDKKRRSDMYEITDLLPEKSKVLPESVAIDEHDIELPNESDKLHHRHVFMSSTSNNSSAAPSPTDNDDGHGLGYRHGQGKRPTGAAALKLLKFSNLRSIITKKSVSMTTSSSQHVVEVTTNGQESERMVSLDIESGLESGMSNDVSTSVKQVNSSTSNGRLNRSSTSPGHDHVHDSSNDTNDSNFGDELLEEEEDIEVPGYMNSNLDEVDTPIVPSGGHEHPRSSVSPSNPLKKAPIALTESEV